MILMENHWAVSSRAAGQHVRSHARELARRMLIGAVAALAMLAIAWLLLGLGSWALVVVASALVGGLLVADRMVGARFERWLQGARGEERVGAALAGPIGLGSAARHLTRPRQRRPRSYRPSGIFGIETKSYRGRIAVAAIDERMLRQACAERKLIEREHRDASRGAARLQGRLPGQA